MFQGPGNKPGLWGKDQGREKELYNVARNATVLQKTADNLNKTNDTTQGEQHELQDPLPGNEPNQA
jgi:hypothetical protein